MAPFRAPREAHERPRRILTVEAGRSRRSVNTSSVVDNNCEQDDELPITARYQRRRRISERKQDNNSLTIVLESEPQVAIAIGEPVVPNIVGAVEGMRSRRRMNTLTEGKRHVDSDCEDDDVPITTILSKPPKELPTPVIPKGNEAIWLPGHGTAYAVPQYPCSTRFFFCAK
jgi:hypothetical protein